MRLVLALVLLLAARMPAWADLMLPASSASIGSPGAAGLLGTYYHEGSGSTGYDVARTIALMNGSVANGTFVSAALSYSGSDSSTIAAFLGRDQASYRGAAPAAYDLSDAILHLTGYYRALTAGTVQFALSNDDAVQFSIGGKVAISSNIGNSTTNVTFAAPGYYAVDLVYSNTNYYNVGGAYLNLTANGKTLTSADMVQSVVPEPASVGLLGAAVAAGLMLARHRRAKAATMNSGSDT